MSPPTPLTISIIIVLRGSTSTSRPTLKLPLCSHVHAVEMCPVCDAFARSPKNDQRAPANATNTDVVESQPAARREMRMPASVIASVPASGAARQSQAPAITGERLSSAQLRQAVDVEREVPAMDRDHEPQSDTDL